MVFLKKEDKPAGEIFYESESLWENYGKAQYDKAKELPGIRKIEEGIGWLLYASPSPRALSTARLPSSA